MFSESRPPLSVADATEILARHYSLQALNIAELVSFDSRIFAVEAVPLPSKEQSGKKTPPAVGNVEKRPSGGGESESTLYPPPLCQKLVLKVFNREMCTAEKLPTTRQQIVCSQFLRRRGFLCPEVVHASNGELMARTTTDNYTLLMTMLPGTQLGSDKNKLTTTVLYELGVFLASMHCTLQECDSQHLDTDPSNPWTIENIHLLSQYLHCIQDEDEKRRLACIIAKFQEIRNNEFHLLQKGLIHGDFHDYNLIVDWTAIKLNSAWAPSQPLPASSEATSLSSTRSESQRSCILQKYGLIDFEAMSVSYPAVKLSRLIADMMIDCNLVELLDIGGHIIAGYMSVNIMPVKEFRFCLYETALACLAQYIILSTYEYQFQGESNEYCLLSTEGSKVVLAKMMDVEAADVYRVWGKVLTSYGIENLFTEEREN